jgi:hypothetical protein
MEGTDKVNELVLAEKKLTSVRRWLEVHIIRLEKYRQQIGKMKEEAKT